MEAQSWLRELKDRRAAACVELRIDRLASGNRGGLRPVGVSELRIDYVPGYDMGGRLTVLFCGGDKASQRKDIEQAQQIAAE